MTEYTPKLWEALAANGPEMLEALQMAYRKHHMGDPSIGWEELSDKLLNTLCEVMGDEAFVAWSNEIAATIN